MNVYDYQGRSISLKKTIKIGGEAAIWMTSFDGQLAKLYKDPENRFEKLKYMVEHPPDNPTKHQNHDSIAWPTNLLRDDQQKFVGFLMPEIKSSVDLISLYNPGSRNRILPGFNWKYLHTAAKNIAWIVYHIHQRGYILGDIQPRNILVNNKALITILDTDSFQVIDKKNNKTYHCLVGSEHFTPPELIGKDLKKEKQNISHDNFRLAVIIYLLLFGGQHPYHGKWENSGDPPSLDHLIQNGWWPFGNDNYVKPTPNKTMPLEIVHPELKKYFLQCFNEGHSKPSKRPSAKDWYLALDTAISDLISCSLKPDYHVYSQIYSQTYNLNKYKCYWCKQFNDFGTDIFHIQKSSLNPQIQKSNTQPTIPKTQPKHQKSKKWNFLFIICIIILVVIIALFFVH